MKKALRVIVPLILILAVLACCAWYLLVYDREFTKEMLLSQARYLEENGKYDAAAKMYDLAYFQSSHEDSIALELAEQYRSMGNYTQAERTVYEAIRQKPTAQLYAFLSKLYVEQDKLLDAVNMLDAIADPNIKAELNAQRPAAPTPSHPSGFYSQYISVGFTAETELIYINTSGDYPSTEKDAYTSPVTLPLGETVFCCISVTPEGLVSPVGIYGYTIGGVIEVVQFQDDAIEASVREILDVEADTPLFTNDLWAVKDFTVPSETEHFEDLALFTRLETLSVYNCPSNIFFGLPEMERLQKLYLQDCQLTSADVDAISRYKNLTHLTMRNCGLSTVAPLSALSKLEYLDLSNNALRNLTPLSKLSALTELYLNANAVTDLSALSDLAQLTVLDASFNSLKSLAPVRNLRNVRVLRIANNQLTSVAELEGLTALTELDVSTNQLADISAISGCSAMEMLNISHNAITDISMLDKMLKLHTLNAAYNQIPALPAFQPDCELVSINISYNLVPALDSLAGLQYLNTVNADYNPELELLDPLDTCPVLIKVNAYGTKVTEVKFLTDKSVVVNFDPTLVLEQNKKK